MNKLPKEVVEYILDIYSELVKGEDYKRIDDVLSSHEWEIEKFEKDKIYHVICSKCGSARYFNMSITKSAYISKCKETGTGVEYIVEAFKDSLTCNEAIIADIII